MDTSQANKLYPANKHALDLLRKAGQDPNPAEDLGMPALLRWAVRERLAAPPTDNRSLEFVTEVERLDILGWENPEKATQFLLKGPPGTEDLEMDVEAFLAEQDPILAACKLANQVDYILSQESEDYANLVDP